MDGLDVQDEALESKLLLAKQCLKHTEVDAEMQDAVVDFVTLKLLPSQVG